MLGLLARARTSRASVSKGCVRHAASQFKRPFGKRPVINHYRKLSNLAKPLQQGGSDLPLRDQHPQLIRPDAQHSRHCLCKTLVAALEEPVIGQKASGDFEP